MPNLNIIFDIDGTIATALNKNAKKSDNNWTVPFKEKDLCIETDQYIHVLHPGVIELIQWLDAMPNTTISFFSIGDKERNNIFVEKLLCRALGETRYHSIKDQVTILSRNDAVSHVSQKQHIEYGIPYPAMGGMKKNLSKIAKTKDDLNWTVLIDDTLSVVYPGQERNLLALPSTASAHFETAYAAAQGNQPLNWETFAHVNHLFYAVGVLLSALEKAKQDEVSKIADVLLSMQFIDNPEVGKKQCELFLRNKEKVPQNTTEFKINLYLNPEDKHSFLYFIEENGKSYPATISMEDMDDISPGHFTVLANLFAEERYQNGQLALTGDHEQLTDSQQQAVQVLITAMDNQYDVTHVSARDNRKMLFNENTYQNKLYYEYGLNKLREINPSLHFLYQEYDLSPTALPSANKEIAMDSTVKSMIVQSGLYHVGNVVNDVTQHNKEAVTGKRLIY